MLGRLKRKIIGPVILFVGVIMIVGGINERNEAARLRASGQTTSSDVVGHLVETGRKGSKTYKLAVEFRPEGGSAPVAREFPAAKEVFDSVDDGQRIDVVYLPSDPSVARLVGDKRDGAEMIGIGAALALVGMVVAYFVLFRRKARKPEYFWPAGLEPLEPPTSAHSR